MLPSTTGRPDRGLVTILERVAGLQGAGWHRLHAGDVVLIACS